MFRNLLHKAIFSNRSRFFSSFSVPKHVQAEMLSLGWTEAQVKSLTEAQSRLVEKSMFTSDEKAYLAGLGYSGEQINEMNVATIELSQFNVLDGSGRGPMPRKLLVDTILRRYPSPEIKSNEPSLK